MRQPIVQVSVDAALKERLEHLSKAHGLSVSSYVRVVINRHILAVDRAAAQQAQQEISLQSFYENL